MPEPFSLPIRIYYEDTDAGGVVFYANYLKFAERCRTEWLRTLGYSQHELWNTEHIGFVVKRCAIDYKRPAILDDLLRITCNVTSSSATSIHMTQEIYREDTILCHIDITLVCVNTQMRPTRLPNTLRQLLNPSS